MFGVTSNLDLHTLRELCYCLGEFYQKQSSSTITSRARQTYVAGVNYWLQSLLTAQSAIYTYLSLSKIEVIYEFKSVLIKVDDTQVVTGVCLTQNDYNISPIHLTTNGPLKIWSCLQGKHSLW